MPLDSTSNTSVSQKPSPLSVSNISGMHGVGVDFNAIADRYDIWYDSSEGIFFDKLEKAVVYRVLSDNLKNNPVLPLPDGSDMKLLEVGCGTGHWSSYFASLGFAVTGVDIAENMLTVARRRKISGADFIKANGELLPFADSSFDISVAITALEFSTSPQRILSEMLRCSRPGGVLILGCLNRLSAYNCRRAQKAGSLYAQAKMFTPDELRDMLKPLGDTRVVVTGFVPGLHNLSGPARMINKIAEFLRLTSGAFIAAGVKLQKD